jgi:hypothetical protein
MKHLRLTLIILISLIISEVRSKEYIIFSVEHQLDMGHKKNDETFKNFFINMGKTQGVTKGTKLRVLRKTIKKNQLDNDKEYQTFIPIGVVKVIHSDEYSSIAIKDEVFSESGSSIILSPNSFMIGDVIKVN